MLLLRHPVLPVLQSDERLLLLLLLQRLNVEYSGSCRAGSTRPMCCVSRRVELLRSARIW